MDRNWCDYSDFFSVFVINCELFVFFIEIGLFLIYRLVYEKVFWFFESNSIIKVFGKYVGYFMESDVGIVLNFV